LPRWRPPGAGCRPGQQAGSCHGLVSWEQDEPEPQVVVAVAGLVPVAVGGPAVPGGVVPAPAADDAVRALGRHPKAVDDAAAKPMTASNAGEFDERRHVAHQVGGGPVADEPLLLVAPELVYEPAPPSGRESDPVGKDPVSQKGDPMAAAVQLNIGL
jgi:hypothetical protein